MSETPAPESPDERLTEQAQKAIQGAGVAPEAQIQAHATAGTVTLQGTVPNKAVKQAAGDAVYALPEVMDVFNELAIEGQDQQSGEQPGDDEIKDQVRAAIRANPEASRNSSTTIRVHEGIVTLQGATRDKWSKQAASEAAFGVAGVVNVYNQMHPAEDQPAV